MNQMIALQRLYRLTIKTTPLLSSLRNPSYIMDTRQTATDTSQTPNDVLNFWFEELKPSDWFNPSNPEELDTTIRNRFGTLLEKASACELYQWRSTPNGSLAEIIVLDQFSRNVYRNTPKAFAQDALALALAQEAVSKGYDKDMEPQRLAFLYMPYMHSESAIIHEKALELFSQPGLEFNYGFEIKHKAIIDRFGRYPHRNKILGRESTPEEELFLKEPGSSF